MKQNLKELISEIKNEIEAAFKKHPIERNDFVDIITKIHSLKFSDRIHLKDLYEKLENDLFEEKNITLSEFDYSLFEKRKVSQSSVDTENIIDTEQLFLDKLTMVIDCIKDDRHILRRHIFIRIDTDYSDDIKILLLHDQNSVYPFYKRIRTQFKDDFIDENIDEFSEKIGNSYFSNLKSSFICLIFLSPGSITAKNIEAVVDKMAGLYSIKKIDIDYDKFQKDDFYRVEGNEEEIKEELKFIISIELLNSQMPDEESRLIRKLYKDDGCHTLEYKKLGGGFTNSNVYEIKPYGQISNSNRSVIKIGLKHGSVISDEIKNHKSCVRNFDQTYSIYDEKTERLIGIRYNYGSSDSQKDSEQFSKLYNRDSGDLCEIVKKLFGIKLMKRWNESEQETLTVKELYKKYIKTDKIFDKIKHIRGNDVTKFIEKINQIYDFNLNTTLKVCHGDLHSDNFLFDGEEVFLIDFGYTGKCHSLIDHTTLECAIKFRLIPFYVPIEELKVIENELLSRDTFNANYAFKNIQRDDLTKPFKIITQIRSLSRFLFISEDDPIEYLISLLMITLKQIKYNDVNQLYALTSAEILTEHIISELKL